MSSLLAMTANTLPDSKPRSEKKSRTDGKGRDMEVLSIGGDPISDPTAIQTVKVSMAFEDSKAASEEHLLEVPESINILV